jgi:hypothetical protein
MRRSHEPLSAKPTVEALETRNLLSTASLAAAYGIVNSPEHFASYITAEYHNLLGRDPDSAGFNSWMTQMENGLAPEAVEAGITASNEYIQNQGGDPTSWLTSLYNNLLGRDPDAAGIDHWLGELQNGASAYQVALWFSWSPEREAGIITEDYSGFLGRSPDPGAVDHWLADIQQGADRADVAARIVASDEYFQLHNGDNTDFIIGAYQDVLGRTPDDSEVAYWLGVMSQNS